MGGQQQTRFVVRAIYGNDNKARRARFLRRFFAKLSISRKFRVASIDMQQITGKATPGLFALTINKCMPVLSGAGSARQRNLLPFSSLAGRFTETRDNLALNAPAVQLLDLGQVRLLASRNYHLFGQTSHCQCLLIQVTPRTTFSSNKQNSSSGLLSFETKQSVGFRTKSGHSLAAELNWIHQPNHFWLRARDD